MCVYGGAVCVYFLLLVLSADQADNENDNETWHKSMMIMMILLTFNVNVIGKQFVEI